MPYQVKGGVIAPEEKSCETCAFKKMCLFDRRDRGGFKGKGPRYIGYVIITDRVELNGAKRDFTTCWNFIESGLQKRLSVGRQLREDGKDGEIVRIIAQEGESFTGTVLVGKNANGEIVRPAEEIRAALEASGHKIASSPMAQAVGPPVTVEYKVTVPRWADWNARIGGFQQSILAEELSHEQAVDVAEEQAMEAVMSKKKAKSAA